MKEKFIAVIVGMLAFFILLMLLNTFFEKFHFIFAWPVKLEKRFPVEVVKYKLVTPTPTPFPKFKLNNGVIE